MASTSTTRKNNYGRERTSPAVLDLETRANNSDHRALRLWLRLLSCTVRIENEIRLRLRCEFNTTLARFDLMAQLDRSRLGLSMSDLSQQLMVSGGNVTGLTDQLEREGLVIRLSRPGDRRSYTVKLTERGTRRFREMAARHEQWIIELMGGLSREEQQTMIHELAKLKAHVNGSRAVALKPNHRRQPGGIR